MRALVLLMMQKGKFNGLLCSRCSAPRVMCVHREDGRAQMNTCILCCCDYSASHYYLALYHSDSQHRALFLFCLCARARCMCGLRERAHKYHSSSDAHIHLQEHISQTHIFTESQRMKMFIVVCDAGPEHIHIYYYHYVRLHHSYYLFCPV
jgi:hypothetical protein